MVGLSMMLYRVDLFGMPMYRFRQVADGVRGGLVAVSMLMYLRAALPYLREQS